MTYFQGRTASFRDGKRYFFRNTLPCPETPQRFVTWVDCSAWPIEAKNGEGEGKGTPGLFGVFRIFLGQTMNCFKLSCSDLTRPGPPRGSEFSFWNGPILGTGFPRRWKKRTWKWWEMVQMIFRNSKGTRISQVNHVPGWMDVHLGGYRNLIVMGWFFFRFLKATFFISHLLMMIHHHVAMEAF